jgi:hypothetical protein
MSLAELLKSKASKKSASKKPEEKKPATASEKKPSSPTKKPATGPNTPSTVYSDTFNTHPKCADDKKNITKRCEPEPAQTEEEKKSGKPAKKKGLAGIISNTTHAVDELGRKATSYERNDANAWVDSHCHGMWYKPTNLAKTSKELNDAVTGTLEKLKGEKWGLIKEGMGELAEVAKAKVGAAAEKKVAGLLARSVAKNVVGGAAVAGTAGTVGTVVEAGMLAWTVSDVLSTAEELAVLAGAEGLAVLENIKDSVNIKAKAEELLNDYKTKPDKALADTMTTLSKFNRCLQAKRCELVPMKNTPARDAAKSGKGCCPGKTGHHLLPKEMFKRKIDVPVVPEKLVKGGPNKGNPKTKSVDDPTNCPEYTDSVHDNAPVVCVEGTNNNHGSHGVIHNNIDELMKNHRRRNPGNDHISNSDAIKAAVTSHNETFKPACNPDCLAAQLHSYYDKLCSGKLKPRGGKGTDVETGDADGGAQVI